MSSELLRKAVKTIEDLLDTDGKERYAATTLKAIRDHLALPDKERLGQLCELRVANFDDDTVTLFMVTPGYTVQAGRYRLLFESPRISDGVDT